MLLWDLLPKARKVALGLGARRPAPPERRAVARGARGRGAGARARSASAEPRANRYETACRQVAALHGVRVRRWRSNTSGIAWQVLYRDGTVARLIEAPRPRGSVSAAVFLHEVGHHAIGFDTYSPRCLEEYEAWMFALRTMREQGLNITEGLRRRVHRSLRYAVGKSRRRGIRSLPAKLEPFDQPIAAAIPMAGCDVLLAALAMSQA